MAFEDALADILDKVAQYVGQLATEEATKTALIMPFISRVLGYDVFNPSEVVPEYVGDLGLKKGEKIDFAIVRDDNNRKPICRLHFNRKQRYLGLFDADKVETKVAIERVEELYAHADQMRETVKRYL